MFQLRSVPVITLLFLLAVAACKPKNESPATPVCHPLVVTDSLTRFHKTTTTYTYAPDYALKSKRIVVTGLNAMVQNIGYTYTAGSIQYADTIFGSTGQGANTNIISNTAATLDAQGRIAVEITSYTYSHYSDTTKYTYNTDGYLIKKESQRSTTTFEWTDGNLTKTTTGSLITTYNYNNLPNPTGEVKLDKIGNGFTDIGNGPLTLYGKGNKNLLIKTVPPNITGSVTFSFAVSPQLDANGYPVTTVSSLMGIQPYEFFTYTYLCP